jgi:hypothetical protein
MMLDKLIMLAMLNIVVMVTGIRYVYHSRCGKNIAQYVLDTTIRKQTQIRQLELNTNRTSFLCGNRNRPHNTEL